MKQTITTGDVLLFFGLGLLYAVLIGLVFRISDIQISGLLGSVLFGALFGLLMLTSFWYIKKRKCKI